VPVVERPNCSKKVAADPDPPASLCTKGAASGLASYEDKQFLKFDAEGKQKRSWKP